MEDFLADDAVRVIVLFGTGGKAFISGAEISKFEQARATRSRRRATTRRASASGYC